MKFYLKICVSLLIIAGGIVYLFSPKPIVKNPESAEIILVLVRTTDNGPGVSYKHVENFDERAILNVLHEAKQRQTLYNYQMYLSDQVDIDLIISLNNANERSYEVNLGNESFTFYSGGDFKHWVLDQEQVLRDVAALIDPGELVGTVLEDAAANGET